VKPLWSTTFQFQILKMNNQESIKIVNKIEDLLSELKKQLEIPIDKNVVLSKITREKDKKQRDYLGGPARQINGLIADGFFDNYKTVNELWKEFKKKALNYNKSVIAVSLMRAVKKKLLIRDGEGNIKNPWKYKINKILQAL